MLEKVLDYKSLVEEIPRIIRDSPYEMSYIVEQMQMSSTTFHRKMKQRRFSVEEMLRLVLILEPLESFKEQIQEALRQSDADLKQGKIKSNKEVMKAIEKRYLKR